MKRVFLDTNVAVDLMAKREPFFEDAKSIFSRSADGKFTLLLSVLSFWNIFYLMRKDPGEAKARKDLAILASLVEVVPALGDDLQRALGSNLKDLEDALQLEAAVRAKAEIIITRDARGFKGAELPIMSPSEFLRLT